MRADRLNDIVTSRVLHRGIRKESSLVVGILIASPAADAAGRAPKTVAYANLLDKGKRGK